MYDLCNLSIITLVIVLLCTLLDTSGLTVVCDVV